MVSIGKITLDGNFNYGNKLQNYALQRFLETFSDRVDTWIHNETDFTVPRRRKFSKFGLEEMVKIVSNRKGFRDKLESNAAGRDVVREYRIYQFDQRYIHTKHLRENEGLSDVQGQYDYWVTGSDQVWNPYFNTKDLPAQFLTFTEPARRIAYSASFGVSAIPEKWKKQYAQWLSDMAYMSVREEAGQKIVKKLTGRDVPVLVDPTLLLARGEWNEAASKPLWLAEETKYILLYFLGGIPAEAEEEIRRIAREHHLQVINVLDSTHMDWYVSDPAEFVYLIAHASLIYTDSFHGSVFSILYERPFVVCERQEKRSEQAMGSRLDTLLSLFHIAGRRGSADNHYAVKHPLEAEYGNIRQILQAERERAEAYMREALRLK